MRSVRARNKRSSLGFEQLENRLPLSAAHASLEAALGHHLEPAKRNVGSAYPIGLTPDATRAYYGFDQVDFGGAPADGTGQTIAIVTARNNPNIVNDLAVFNETFDLPDAPSFRVVNQMGGTKLPKKNRGWASEAALDVEWAHAIAPGANILLVEAKNDSMASFIAAIDYARHAPGVTVVSVSASGDEFKSETMIDSLFTTPPGHPGVTFVFASGDDGGTAEYPSSSPNVLSVGGTTLSLSYPPQWYNETVWSYGGGGESQFEGVPSYQDGLGLSSRGTPDVSYNADPYTGFAVFDSYGSRGWEQFGGTSAGAPQWAALLAIVNQGRELAGKTPLANAQAVLYAMPSNDFHDIVNGDNQSFSASPGYDLASGLGSPIADRLIPDMVAFNGSTNFTVGLPPIVQQTQKSTRHFSIAVDPVAADSLGYHTSLLSAHISLPSIKATFASSAFPLSSSGGGPAAVPNETTMRTGHQSRFKSQIRKSDMAAKLAGKHLHDVDAYFAKLASGVAAG